MDNSFDKVLKDFQEYSEHFEMETPEIKEIDYPVTGVNPAIEEKKGEVIEGNFNKKK